MDDNDNQSAKEVAAIESLSETDAKPKLWIQNGPLMGLFIMSLFLFLKFTHVIFLPIVIAILLNFILSPVIKWLKQIWVPPSISAFLVISIFFISSAVILYGLATPIHRWLNEAPQAVAKVKIKTMKLASPVLHSFKKFSNLSEQAPSVPEDQKAIEPSSLSSTQLIIGLFSNTGFFIMQLLVTIFLLYFLLVSQDFFLRNLVEILPHLRAKKEAIVIMRSIKEQISIYLVTKTLLNVGLGLVLSVVLFMLNMPNPILWGIVGGLLEFIPYLGVSVGTIAILFSSVLIFDDTFHIIMIPLAFFLISSFEGNVLTPYFLGRSLSLHPVIIFVAIIIWGWLWGIPGAFISIPIISIFKIICDNIPKFNYFSKFLSED